MIVISAMRVEFNYSFPDQAFAHFLPAQTQSWPILANGRTRCFGEHENTRSWTEAKPSHDRLEFQLMVLTARSVQYQLSLMPCSRRNLPRIPCSAHSTLSCSNLRPVKPSSLIPRYARTFAAIGYFVGPRDPIPMANVDASV